MEVDFGRRDVYSKRHKLKRGGWGGRGRREQKRELTGKKPAIWMIRNVGYTYYPLI
jgi:hypothetical protein